MSEVEAALQRINGHAGVVGTVIVNADGKPIRSNCELASMARNTIRDLDPQNELKFLRIRSKLHEIMVAPERDFTMIVIQDPRLKE